MFWTMSEEKRRRSAGGGKWARGEYAGGKGITEKKVGRRQGNLKLGKGLMGVGFGGVKKSIG